MQKTLGISLALLLMMGCSDNDKETSATQLTVANETAEDKAFNESFLLSCVNSATQSGQLSRANATTICQCSLIEFRKKYSVEQASAIFYASDEERTAVTKFSTEIGIACAKKFKAGKL